jgi:thymidylate synthase (FAD)
MIREDLLEKVPLLDHGYMRYDEHWGSDEKIIVAARQSTGKGFLGWDPGPCETCGGKGTVVQMVNGWRVPPEYRILESGARILDFGFAVPEARDVPCLTCNGKGQLAGDAKLLKFLWSNKHATPFEMAGLTVETQAPIMVFREWHRHRTQSYNEMSARYTPMPDLNYVPTLDRCLTGGGHLTKQAGKIATAGELTAENAEEWRELLARAYEASEAVYQYGLSLGIPKELGRLIVPVGRYSRMMASTDLRNWLAFLTLRMEAGAQWEIRQYANQVGRYVRAIFPRTWDLFVEGKSYML